MAVAKILLVTFFCATALVTASPLQQEDGLSSLVDDIAGFIQKQEVDVDLPWIGSTVSVGARGINNDEVDVKVKLGGGEEGKTFPSRSYFLFLFPSKT